MWFAWLGGTAGVSTEAGTEDAFGICLASAGAWDGDSRISAGGLMWVAGVEAAAGVLKVSGAELELVLSPGSMLSSSAGVAFTIKARGELLDEISGHVVEAVFFPSPKNHNMPMLLCRWRFDESSSNSSSV